jgi:cytochrome c6
MRRLSCPAFCMLLASAALQAVASGATEPEPRTYYMEACSACHQPEGKGITGVFPALAGSTVVKGDSTELVRTILAGRNGMPSFKNDLGDDQLAAIVTHLRTSWGNGGKPVTAEFIADVRRRTNNPKGQNPAMSN